MSVHGRDTFATGLIIITTSGSIYLLWHVEGTQRLLERRPVKSESGLGSELNAKSVYTCCSLLNVRLARR